MKLKWNLTEYTRFELGPTIHLFENMPLAVDRDLTPVVNRRYPRRLLVDRPEKVEAGVRTNLQRRMGSKVRFAPELESDR